MTITSRASTLAAAGLISLLPLNAEQKPVRLMTLDPGHFHAALVQKSMYDDVSPAVHVFAPTSPDLDLHLKRINGFNTRPENPTHWKTQVHRTDNSLEAMLKQRPGNVVILAGDNSRKTDNILASVKAGINVLADKPMVINPEGMTKLREAFKVAQEKNVLLYDIMTERHEITTILQRELSQIPALYGQQATGTPEQPAVTKESVHHYFKYVSGKPLKRPPWFFDVTAEGEGIVDVTTHLVDLIQWECFPGETLKQSDVKMLSARTWPTKLTLAQFKKATGLEAFPDYLKKYINADGILEVDCNGEMVYTLKGIHCKTSVIWNFEAPKGAKDTHYSIMQGRNCALVIRQGAEQGYQPTLYIEPVKKGTGLTTFVQAAVHDLQKNWPGVTTKTTTNGWQVVIPEKYKIGHEGHFAQVTKAYLDYLKEGKLPEWEVPNMLVKYQTIMDAYQLSRKK
ncbi:MAG: oxidoreductase [Verrucomicrobiae bacterium]|nr:oxidoreductase [Verrucomicrobiae bacterium]NNJ43692.1 oxidoreductase [Akkermansiaceae bacterium]